MEIPKFVSVQLRTILANHDLGLKKEGSITYDLGEYLAMNRVYLESERSERNSFTDPTDSTDNFRGIG